MDTDITRCDVIVIGAGLAGLTAAHILQQAQLDFQLLEAAPCAGGRIAAVLDEQNGKPLADLGPTWVWPPYQPSVRRWIDKLQITTYAQYEQGDALIDVQADGPPMRRFLPGQHGIARMVGGPSALINALQQQIDAQRMHFDCPVTDVRQVNDRFAVRCGNGRVFNAGKVIVAAPLRAVSEQIDWSDLLDDQALSVMRDAPTWMATQAKVAILYDQAFWRDAGLSGRVASQVGPLVEVHDHCGMDADPAALFGFVGWPAHVRQGQDIRPAIIDQLVRCFGEAAAGYERLEICDWASVSTICSQRDLQTAPAHPQRLPESMRAGFCNHKLFFAVAETAVDSPGLIDGALEAGSRAANQVIGE